MKKRILITGSTDGIGKLAAEKLLKQGHQVILHGRSKDKLDKVRKSLEAETGQENLHPYAADLGDLEQVRQLAVSISRDFSSIDVLVNNAGVFKTAQTQAKSGRDLRFEVNYLAPYILTTALIPTLLSSGQGRVINLSSAAQAPVSLVDLSGGRSLSDQDAYAQSKLALAMWSFDLAKKQTNLCTIALNPGSLLNTKMVQEAYGQFWSAADKGADIIIDLALDQKYQGHSGEYFDNDRGSFGPAHADAYDAKKIADLIEATEKIVAKS